jgi:lipopolysaccharide export system protein LptA
MSLYNPDTLKKFLEGYFGDQTLSSLGKNISFEVFELKNKEVITLKNETRIVDMLMMELAFPPYYSYYEYQGGFFIPTSYLSFIPQKFPKDAVIISFDPVLTYPYPKNTVEILLKTSYSRTLKNYRLLTEGFNTIEPQKQLKNYFNMSAFFGGQSMKRFTIFFLMLTLTNLIIYSAQINVKADEVKGEESRYILKNNVFIQKEDLSISTDFATITLIDDEWRDVNTEKVYITGDTFEATSTSMSFDLQTEKGTLSGNVLAKIFLEESEIEISSDELQIDNNNKRYEGSSKDLVLIQKEDYIINAKSFVFVENENLLTLSENVHIINSVKKIDMTSAYATFNTQTNDIEAQAVNLILEVAEEEE